MHSPTKLRSLIWAVLIAATAVLTSPGAATAADCAPRQTPWGWVVPCDEGGKSPGQGSGGTSNGPGGGVVGSPVGNGPSCTQAGNEACVGSVCGPWDPVTGCGPGDPGVVAPVSPEDLLQRALAKLKVPLPD